MRTRNELTVRLWRRLRLIGKQLQNIAHELLAACRASRVERAQAFVEFLGDDTHTRDDAVFGTLRQRARPEIFDTPGGRG